MALITTIAGRYSSTYTPPSGSALDLGITLDPGYKISFVPAWIKINNTDAWAENLIEGVWRGFSMCGIDFVGKEWKSGPLRASNPGSTYAASGATTFRPGVPGRLMTALAGILVMSSTAGTPAASSPATLTATFAAARPGFSFEWLYGPVERLCPVALEFIAYDGGSGVAEYFVCT
jgi:hypothetical protein